MSKPGAPAGTAGGKYPWACPSVGIPVQQMLFQELDDQSRYDGIWACSSILHLAKEENGVTYHHPQIIGEDKYRNQLRKLAIPLKVKYESLKARFLILLK